MDRLTLIDTVYQHLCTSFLVHRSPPHADKYLNVCLHARDSLKSWDFKWMGFVLQDIALYAWVSSLTVLLCALSVHCYNIICIFVYIVYTHLCTWKVMKREKI